MALTVPRQLQRVRPYFQPALPIRGSVDDLVILARPVADTIAKVDAGLRQVRWPARALDHIRTELAADKSLCDALLGTLDVTLMGPNGTGETGGSTSPSCVCGGQGPRVRWLPVSAR